MSAHLEIVKGCPLSGPTIARHHTPVASSALRGRQRCGRELDSSGGWGLLVTQIDRKVLAACRKHGKLIASLVLNVTGMPLYPPHVDLMALTQLEQPIPQLPIRNDLP